MHDRSIRDRRDADGPLQPRLRPRVDPFLRDARRGENRQGRQDLVVLHGLRDHHRVRYQQARHRRIHRANEGRRRDERQGAGVQACRPLVRAGPMSLRRLRDHHVPRQKRGRAAHPRGREGLPTPLLRQAGAGPEIRPWPLPALVERHRGRGVRRAAEPPQDRRGDPGSHESASSGAHAPTPRHGGAGCAG